MRVQVVSDPVIPTIGGFLSGKVFLEEVRRKQLPIFLITLPSSNKKGVLVISLLRGLKVMNVKNIRNRLPFYTSMPICTLLHETAQPLN